jgi:DNA-binding CsgD family transcriptional regulator
MWLCAGGETRVRKSRPALSPRQQQVLAELKLGRTESQIAKRMRVSYHTVHSHVMAVYRHFSVRSRAQLMAQWVKR